MGTVNLTDALVKALKCGSGQRLREVRDADVHGLEIRVTGSGGKSWRLHYTRRSDGKRRVIGLGTYPAISLKEARTRAKRLQAEIEDETIKADPAGERRARRVAETFSEIAEEWLERHGKPNKSRRAVVDDQSMLARHILPEIGAMKAAEVTKRDVIRLLDAVAAKPDARNRRAPARKMTHRPNRVFELVRAIFRWAIGRDLLKFDPTFGLSPPIKKEKPRERDLSPGEIRALWLALDGAPASRRYTQGLRRGSRAVSEGDIPMTSATALTLKLALVTGQRIGEVAGIAISQLDLNDTAPVWIVPGERSKNGQPHRVPLSRLAVGLIEEARALSDDKPWLFPSPKGAGPIDPHAPTKALARARTAIGLEQFRIHDLRRTAARRMAEMGFSPHTISLVLNHVSARRGTVTAAVYVQYSYDREKREALDAWGARLERIIAGAEGSKSAAIRSDVPLEPSFST
jgi:integrase